MHPVLRRIADHFRAKGNVVEFSPLDVDPDLLPHLFVIDIERADGDTKLKIRLVGTALDQAFQRPTAGHYLEEFVHGPRGQDVLREFHACASARRPVWMRQVVHIREQAPKFVEGVAFYLHPDRLYGGLLVGEMTSEIRDSTFESRMLDE